MIHQNDAADIIEDGANQKFLPWNLDLEDKLKSSAQNASSTPHAGNSIVRMIAPTPSPTTKATSSETTYSIRRWDEMIRRTTKRWYQHPDRHHPFIYFFDHITYLGTVYLHETRVHLCLPYLHQKHLNHLDDGWNRQYWHACALPSNFAPVMSSAHVHPRKFPSCKSHDDISFDALLWELTLNSLPSNLTAFSTADSFFVWNQFV